MVYFIKRGGESMDPRGMSGKVAQGKKAGV